MTVDNAACRTYKLIKSKPCDHGQAQLLLSTLMEAINVADEPNFN